ncbi:MAG: hypothetical protein ABI876_06610, partial [Bacteroidota bacterium]
KDKKGIDQDLEYSFSIFPRLKERMKQAGDSLAPIGTRWNVMIGPMPGDSMKYYVFTTYVTNINAGTNYSMRQFRYSIVDMRADGGLGDVIVRNKVVIAPASEILAGVVGCGNDHYWVLTHSTTDDRFYAYRVTPIGIDPPVISSIGLSNLYVGEWGELTISPDGRRLAMTGFYSDLYKGDFMLLDFDIQTGRVSNPIVFPSSIFSNTSYGTYSTAFSPNGNKLYVSGADYLSGIYSPHIDQYDLTAGTLAEIIASRFEISRYGTFTSWIVMRLAPDGRIYCSNSDPNPVYSLNVITNPNATGAASKYVDGGFHLDFGRTLGSLPIQIVGGPYARSIANAGPDTAICPGDSTRLTASGGTTYSWSPASGLSCTDCSSPMASPATTTTYAVAVSSPGICPTLDSVTVLVNTPPVAAPGNDQTICKGTSATLSTLPQKGYSYRWSPTTTLSCTDCPTTTATPDTTTSYTLTVTNDKGCSASAVVRVIVLKHFGHDPSNDTTICLGQSAILNAPDGLTWLWSPGTGLSCTTCRHPVAGPTTTTTYAVVVTASGGCTYTDSATVTVVPAMSISAGTDTTICAGGSAKLHASGGASWNWSPAAGLSCADCPDPIASPAVATTYTVVARAPGSCAVSAAVTVTVIPTFVPVHRTDTICTGGSIQLHAHDGNAWNWSPASGLSCADCREPVASPASTTTYRAIVTGQGGCDGIDSFTVVVLPGLSADAGNDTATCGGNGVMLHARGGDQYHWSPATGLSCADCPDPIASPATRTIYLLTALNAAGCASLDSVMVDVLPPPVITAGTDTTFCDGGSAHLHATGATSYRWTPTDGLSCADCPDPIASPAQTTIYTVIRTAINGCQAFGSVTVNILPRRIINTSIPRDLHLLPGSAIEVPIIIDDPAILASTDHYALDLRYRPGIVRIGGMRTARTASAGWEIASRKDTTGRASIVMRRPPGVIAPMNDTLLVLQLRAYVGDSIASELPFSLDLDGGECFTLKTTPGLVHLDSICGLNLRLIEAIAGEYRLTQNIPNPFEATTAIDFSLGLDGPTTLTVIDARGETVATLVNGMMNAGKYSVVWTASSAPSGRYYCKLTSGDWTGSMILLLAR